MRGRVAAALTAAVLALGGCGGSDDGDGAGQREASATDSQPDASQPTWVDVGGRTIWMQCEGEGSPTVVLESGLNSNSTTWLRLVPDIAATTRVCLSDRAGLGRSEPSDAAPSAGAAADDLSAALTAAGVAPPYVLVGHSYGGMVVRAFAAQHAADTAGLVLVDSAVPEEFTAPYFADIDWVEADKDIDKDATAQQLRGAEDLGDLPVVVLTQGQATGPFKRIWTGYQDALATMSSNSLHVVALDSDHFIQEKQPDLVVAAVDALVAAVQAGGTLGRCSTQFESVGGQCR